MGEHRDYHQEYYSGGLGSRDNRTGGMYFVESDMHPQSGNNQTIRENQTPAADEHEDTDSFSSFWSARVGEHLQNPSSQSDRHDTAEHPSDDHSLRDVKIQQRQAIKNREDYRVKELTHDYDAWDEKEQLRRYEESQELEKERWRKKQQKLRDQKAESERRRQQEMQELQDKEKKEKEHMWREREGVIDTECESRRQDEVDMGAVREHRELRKQELQDKEKKEKEHMWREREGVIDAELESRRQDEVDMGAVREHHELRKQELQDKEKKGKEHVQKEREGVIDAESESRRQDEADMRAIREHRELRKQELQDKEKKGKEHVQKEREGVIDAESESRRQDEADMRAIREHRELRKQELQDKEKKHMWREREGVIDAESESRRQYDSDMGAIREHRELRKQALQDKEKKEKEHVQKEREGVIDAELESRRQDEADMRAIREHRQRMYLSSLRGDFESSSGIAAEVEGQSHSSVVLDSGPIKSGGTDQWECERCTFLNSNELRVCEMCDIPRERKTEVAGNYGRSPPAKYVGTGEHPQEIPFDYGRRVYHVLSGTSSQYTAGAVSACTTIALQAVHSILNALTDSRFPYGCSPALIDDIVRLGSTYKGDFHQDLNEVLKTRRDLTAHEEKGLRPVGTMVDVSPQNPVPGLRRGLEWNRSLKANVACVLTCQAQSICVVYVYSPSLSPHTDSDVKFILFDSHSRQHNGVNYGACLLFFNSLDDVCHYIQLLFPSIDMPALSIQSEFEQAQYAAITVGQADFFCLKRSWSMRPDAMLQSNPSTPLEEFQRSGSICSSTGYQTPGSVQYNIHDEFDRERIRAIELTRDQAIEREMKLLADIRDLLMEQRALQVALSCEKDEHVKTKEALAKKTILLDNIEYRLLRAEEDAQNFKDRSLSLEVLLKECLHEKNTHQTQRLPCDDDVDSTHRLEHKDQARGGSRRIIGDCFMNGLNVIQMETDKMIAQQMEEEEMRLAEDAAMAMKLMQETVFCCTICRDDEVSYEDMFDLEHADHKLCRVCASRYIQTALKDRTVPVRCPFEGCDLHLSESKCFEVLSCEEQEFWLELSKRPQGDPGFRQCPVPDCKGFDLKDDEVEADCTCRICHHHWCSNCQVDLIESQHTGISCSAYQQWKKDNETGDEKMDNLLQEGLEDKRGKDRMRRCPSCQRPWSKDEACNHVVCAVAFGGCGVHFCFKCANFSASTATEIYNHQPSCRG